MRITVVGNPQNRRVTMFAEAAHSRGLACNVVAWTDLIRGNRSVEAGSHVRIESYGEDADVDQLLLGPKHCGELGRIVGLRAAHRRFAEVLGELPAARYMSTPDAILAMFDKVETKRRLTAAGVPVPRTFGVVATFDALRATMRDSGYRAFVKPRHGSSASGVIALTMSQDRITAVTSVERADNKLFNSLKIRRYDTFEEVAKIIDLLGAEDELLVEEWVPKANAQGATYDLRVVAIGNRADHAVMRLSKSPMTNLHLGNARGDLEALKSDLGGGWDDVQQLAVRVRSAFEGALYTGVDIALTPDLRHLTVFEANAFGDLLPNVVDAEHRSTYEAEIDAFMARGDS